MKVGTFISTATHHHIFRDGQPTRRGLPRPRPGETLWQNGHTLVGKKARCLQVFGGVHLKMFSKSSRIIDKWGRDNCLGMQDNGGTQGKMQFMKHLSSRRQRESAE
eukprot:607490-Pelagomonas_calceolata.AAC.1